MENVRSNREPVRWEFVMGEEFTHICTQPFLFERRRNANAPATMYARIAPFRAVLARYFFLPRLCPDCVFSSVRQVELGVAGATLGFACFGFFASRLLRRWPFGMSVLPNSRQAFGQTETGQCRERVAAR